MNRELLKIKEYVYLLLAQSISNLGDWLDMLAIMALIGLKWHASPLAVSFAMLCLVVPSFVLGSFAGVIADRFDRKTLMIAVDLFRAATVIGIAFSTELWQIYSLLCLKSAFSAVFEPAKEGKLKEIVKDELIQPAVATSELVNNGAKIVGPMVSGALVASVGTEWAFYMDSLSFILSALLLLGVPAKNAAQTDFPKPTLTKEESKSSFFSQFVDGFAFLKRSSALMAGLVVFSLMMLALQICDSQFIVLLREVPGAPVEILGWIMAGSGAGVVAASIVLNKKEVHSYLFTLSLSSMGLGIGFVLAGSLIHIPVFWVALIYPIAGIIFGFCFGMALIPFNVMAQKFTPNHYTGRVFGTINSVGNFAVVIGMLSGGLISEAFGVVFTYIFSGSLLVLIGAIVYGFRRRFEGGKIDAESDTGTHQQAQS